MATTPPRNWPLHLTLFVATCITTFWVWLVTFDGGVYGSQQDKVVASVLYALVVVGTLLAHELGHYLMARAHGVDATLPYFIPVPFGFGTMGAVIRLRGRIPTRNALVDIGAAGPLAGLLIAVPMLFVGAAQSEVITLPDDAGSGVPPALSLINFGSMLGLWVKSLIWDTPLPPAPLYQVFGDNLLTWLAVRVTHGELAAGKDIAAHPIFIAAWFGLVMTMLNLLPVGQLDGGHLTHAWYGERAEKIGERVAGLTLVLALVFSASWLLWFFIVTRLVGFGHPPVERPQEPLSTGRKVVVLITWLMTGLTFMPMPLSMV
ncbi:MAG: site-2 protease family protein [Myxococcota bacterium]